LASLQLQNRDLQKLANELFNRLNDADTALSEQRHMNKVLGKQVMNLQERIDVLTKLDEDLDDLEDD